jgi:hypothetical protein
MKRGFFFFGLAFFLIGVISLTEVGWKFICMFSSFADIQMNPDENNILFFFFFSFVGGLFCVNNLDWTPTKEILINEKIRELKDLDPTIQINKFLNGK